MTRRDLFAALGAGPLLARRPPAPPTFKVVDPGILLQPDGWRGRKLLWGYTLLAESKHALRLTLHIDGDKLPVQQTVHFPVRGTVVATERFLVPILCDRVGLSIEPLRWREGLKPDPILASAANLGFRALEHRPAFPGLAHRPLAASISRTLKA